MKKMMPGRMWIFFTAVFFLAGCAVNPVTGKKELSLMSEGQEVETGRTSYPLYTQASGGTFGGKELNAYVDRVGQSVARVSHRPGLPYEFNVVNDSAVNAYALPGGKISITRGLLAKMENGAQMAGVLAHEVGHVTARHSAAGYTRQVLTGALMAVGGAFLESSDVRGAGLIMQGSGLAANLVLSKYSRDQERQADELGMEYMTAAGYNPEGFIQSMEILLAMSNRKESAIEAMMSSHPLTSERVADAKKTAARLPPSARTEEGLKKREFAEALAYLKKVNPSYEKSEKGIDEVRKGRKAEGLAFLKGAAADAPLEARLHLNLAAAELETGDAASSEKAIEKALALDPGLYDVRFAAGVIYFNRTRYEKSLAELNAAEGIVKGQPQTSFFRGRCYENMGSREKAAREYAQVVKQVDKGPMAEHSYKKLVEWGYIKK